MFKVLQIALEKEDFMALNEYGWEGAGAYSPRIRAYVKAAIRREYQESFSMGYHQHVATVDCETLSDVFEIGNIGPENRITRHSPMQAVSVGDVIETPEGEFFAVASFGFEKVNSL